MMACTPCVASPSAASGNSVGRSAPTETSSMPAAASAFSHSPRENTLFTSPGANTVPTRRRLGIAALPTRIMYSQSNVMSAPVTFGMWSVLLFPAPAATPEAIMQNTTGRSVIRRTTACNAGVVNGTTISGFSSAIAAMMVPSVPTSSCASRSERWQFLPST